MEQIAFVTDEHNTSPLFHDLDKIGAKTLLMNFMRRVVFFKPHRRSTSTGLKVSTV